MTDAGETLVETLESIVETAQNFLAWAESATKAQNVTMLRELLARTQLALDEALYVTLEKTHE